MALAHLLSEISETPNVYDSLAVSYDAINKLDSVTCEEDIDELNKLLCQDINVNIGGYYANVSTISGYVRVAKPYINYSEKDFFI